MVVFVIGGCGKNDNSDTAAEFDGYSKVVSEDHIALSEALDMLKRDNTGNSEAIALAELLGSLEKCSGKYFQESDYNGGDVYTAELGFYLSRGEVCCEIEYSNYSGILTDGQVEATNEKTYPFATYPTGEFLNRTQYFTIKFNEEKMHITWGSTPGDDTCDYCLTRSDKYTGDQRERFEDSDLYDTLIENLDTTFEGYDYRVVYKETDLELDIYIKAESGTREALLSYDESLLEAWDEVIKATENYCEVYYSALKTPGYVTSVKIFWVDRIIENNAYTTNNIISMVENGEEKYSMLYS